jgi:multicomponent Na+:H+ antiporter subunit B
MRQVVSIMVVVIIGVLIFGGLFFSNSDGLNFSGYGDADLNERVSQKYIDKSVNGESGGVEYNNSANLESGSANYVTSIIVNYRSFDTLGEITVLFISALGVSLLLGGKRKRRKNSFEPSFILKAGARLVFGFMVLFGIYMFTHGHLTPGGGFPGGSIIAAAILLLYLADDEFRVKLSAFKATEGVAGSLYVIIGLVAVALGGYFLTNFMPTGVVGDLISGGVIPIVYILIGLKVGSEITGIIDSFVTQEVE